MFLTFVCVLSIGWKITIHTRDHFDPIKDLVSFLGRNHFAIQEAEKATEGFLIVRATAASCRVQITSLAPDGSDQVRFQISFAAGAKRSFIVFRGQVYPQQPIFWTTLDDLWSKLLRDFGFIRHAAPILAVAADSSCNAERLPWNELQ